MNQQINLYQAQFRPQTNMFTAVFMVKAISVAMVGLMLAYMFAEHSINGIEQEISIVSRQEAFVLERLEGIGPLISSVTGEMNWSEQLDDSLRMLAERQAVLNLIQGTTLGDTKGFSQHLRALARQDVDGLWLTRFVLSALGDKTRLEGRANRADVIPLYVQGLISEAPFSKQKFHQFQIDNDFDGVTAISFSLDSEILLTAGARELQ